MNTNIVEYDNCKTTKLEEADNKFTKKSIIFLSSVTGISAIVGFTSAIAAAKKHDPNYFNKGIVSSSAMHESGTLLAMRALGWGSAYAITGCSILFYSIWKFSGAKDLQDFRQRIGTLLPRIPKNDPPQGRTEFTGLNDLLEYLTTLKTSKSK